MNPIIKWPGGKKREMKKILENIPNQFDTIVEPFFGGGAFSLEFVDTKKIIGSDIDLDLVNFYNSINDQEFLDRLRLFCAWWDNDGSNNECPIQIQGYIQGVSERNSKSIKHIFYYSARSMYNHYKLNDIWGVDRAILFYIMRELSFSSMFRFNSLGEFNVPYGGFAYNAKSFMNKYRMAEELSGHDINIIHSDFVAIIEEHKNNSNNLIFLDPPYDSVFKDYNSNSFGQRDHIRLRDSLMNSDAKILLIINDTQFIRNLYEEFFTIDTYDKKYSVNFKNRNNQDVTHLVIKNY